MTKHYDLDGVGALVTGAGSGLGAAMASALADAGARVVVADVNAARAHSVAQSIGDSAIVVALDVRDEDSVAACVEASWKSLGRLDVLVNNAGLGMLTVNPRFMTDPQPFWNVSRDGFRDLVDTKMLGCFLMARAVVPRMLADGGGRIVNISMNAQTMVRRGFVPYGPAGAGVEALSRVMAADLADTTVTVNMLNPGGATRTGQLPDEIPASLRDGVMDPSVMGPPIVWLASEAAAGVHDRMVVAKDFDLSRPVD